MQETSISWASCSWNPTRGCSRVSPGCERCYAEKFAGRFATPTVGMPAPPYEGLVRLSKKGWQWTGEIKLVWDKLEEPLHWRKPERIFVNSMSDLFHVNVPFSFVARVFDVMQRSPWHTYMILTKRPDRMRDFFFSAEGARFDHHAGHDDCGPLPNVFLGTSVESQEYTYRISELLAAPAAVHMVSLEPLLGPIDLSNIPCPECRPEGRMPLTQPGCNFCCPEGSDCYNSAHHGFIDAFENGLGWVIVGCESGARARPMDPDWVRLLRDQCEASSTPFFLKQMRDGNKTVETPFFDGHRWTETPVNMERLR